MIIPPIRVLESSPLPIIRKAKQETTGLELERE